MSLMHRAAPPNGINGTNGTDTFGKTQDGTPALPSQWLAAFEARAPWNPPVPKGPKGADSTFGAEPASNMLVPLGPKGVERPDDQRRARCIAAACPSEWIEGIAMLANMTETLDWPTQRWPVLIEDARTFLERWAMQAHHLGWHNWELFGCHRRKPWGAIHGMGLVLQLGGRQMVAMTSTGAAILTATGHRQTYRRKTCDPLYPGERALIWELDR